MKTNVKNNLIKIAMAVLSICLLGALLFGFRTQTVKAVQDPVFEIQNGAYVRELDANFNDNTAIRFTVKLTDTWVEQNLSGEEGVDFRFYSKVTLNGKTQYKSWSTVFDENGVYYRNVDLANFPTEDMVSNIYSHEFTVAFGVTTIEDLSDGVVDSAIYETDSVTRTMEYVAARALSNGETGISEYIGGGNAIINNKDNVIEVLGTNTSPDKVLYFNGYNGSDIESFYINGVKQNVNLLTPTSGGVIVNFADYTFGEDYSFVIITSSGDALIADKVTFADFEISDIASYLEWYNIGTSTSVKYYASLSQNVYLTENERLAKAPSKYLGNGTMDGRGYVLDGLRLSYTGLWKDIGTFTFKNIALTNIHHDCAAGSVWASLFSYNDAVSLTFDNVWLSYLNETTSPSKNVGFTAYSTSSTDKNVHFYNSVIVSNQPNSTATIFKLGVVGTLSNTKVISLNDRYVTTGVSADYTSLDEYYSDTTMNTSGYNMDVWRVRNGVLYYKELSNKITLSSLTVGKNLLEDSVSIPLDSTFEIQEVTLDGATISDYTFENGVLTVAGFGDKELGSYTINIVVVDNEEEVTYIQPVSVVNNKTATDAHYNGYILLDGVTKYKLIVPSATDTYSAKAISDFQTLFKEATGTSISYTADKSTISYSDSSRYIVLGGSYIYDKAGLTVDETVEQDGYQIVTKGQSIFILGTTTRGKLFGAYELLSKLFNYERFSVETYTIDTAVKHKALPLFDFIDNPDAELRIGGWGSVYYDSEEEAALTMRFDMNYKDLWVEDTVYGANWTHNIAEIMDYVGHIPADRSKIVDNFGNPLGFDTTVSGWYNNYTMTYSYTDPLNKTGTRYGYDVSGVRRKSYGFKVGWFSVAATSSQMASYGDPLACTTNKDAIINKVAHLCYSGGTYPTDTEHPVFDEMVEFGAKRVANIINAYTGKNKIFQITAEDNANLCQCRACCAWYDHYSQGNLYLNYYVNQYNVIRGAGFMGLQLRFVNALANYITEHDLLNEDKKDVKIATFCYSGYTDAPCIEQADGTFKPVDDAVVCPDNVLIYFAPSMDYTNTISDATQETNPTNYKMLRILKAMDGICNHVGAWLYQMSDYDDYFLPSNNYYAYGDIYRTFIDMGAKWIFHQGAQKRTTRNTAFAQLKLYLNSKLQWDASLDEQELIDKFFDGYFGPASQTMQDFFYDVYNVADSNGGTTTLSRDVFSQSDLEYWIELCEQALEDIAPLKTTDSTRYNLLVQNINCEMMMPRYLLIRLYRVYKGSTFTNSQLSTIKTQFISECKAAGVLEGNNQDVIANVNLNYVS